MSTFCYKIIQFTINKRKVKSNMNFSRILFVFTLFIATLAGNAEAGKGSDALNKIGGLVVSFLLSIFISAKEI